MDKTKNGGDNYSPEFLESTCFACTPKLVWIGAGIIGAIGLGMKK